MPTPDAATLPQKFTPYQKFIVGILAFLQFTIILDFMILSPLGALLMPALNITTAQFGFVVSAYALSAGASSFLAAGFADRFDRKRFLLFFYAGFVLGTLFCGLAPDYPSLLAARMITGIFGGVVGSVAFAIVTDLFPLQMRGRVMGILQTAFAASQVLGIPLGLYLSNHWGWHMPFLLIVVVSTLVGLLIVFRMQPVRTHLALPNDRNPFRHLLHTVSQKRYLQGFLATALLSTGGFLMMPFSSAYNVHNLGVSMADLPLVYIVTGVTSIFAGPLIGRWADLLGKFKTFCIGSAITIVTVMIYVHLPPSPLPVVMIVSAVMFVGISSRMISSSALMSAMPEPADRGAYMSVASSVQQVSGGAAAALGGMIVVQAADGRIEHFDMAGYVLVGTTLTTVAMLYTIDQYLRRRT